MWITMAFEDGEIVDELTDGHPGGIGVCVLWQEAEATAYVCSFPWVSRIETKDSDGPLGGVEGGCEQTEKGGLPCAVWSDNSCNAFIEVEAYPLEGLGSPVADVDRGHTDHRVCSLR